MLNRWEFVYSTLTSFQKQIFTWHLRPIHFWILTYSLLLCEAETSEHFPWSWIIYISIFISAFRCQFLSTHHWRVRSLFLNTSVFSIDWYFTYMCEHILLARWKHETSTISGCIRWTTLLDILHFLSCGGPLHHSRFELIRKCANSRSTLKFFRFKLLLLLLLLLCCYFLL